MTCQSAALCNNTTAGPATLYAQAENRAPSIPETRAKGQHGPLDISYDNTSGCVMWGRVGVSMWEKQKKQTK